MPKCESSCNKPNNSGWNFNGTTIRLPLTTMPSTIDSSSLKFQKDFIGVGHCLISLGHPCMMNFFNKSNCGSRSDSHLIGCNLEGLAFNSNVDISKSRLGSVSSSLGVGCIFLLRWLAKIIDFPGLYWICTLYFCNLSSSRWSLGGALTRSFFTMADNGLWLDSMQVDVP